MYVHAMHTYYTWEPVKVSRFATTHAAQWSEGPSGTQAVNLAPSDPGASN